MEVKTRKKLEALLWKNTSKDYRGTLDGRKTILHMDEKTGGTCLVFISDLTDTELLAKLPKKLLIQVAEDRPS